MNDKEMLIQLRDFVETTYYDALAKFCDRKIEQVHSYMETAKEYQGILHSQGEISSFREVIDLKENIKELIALEQMEEEHGKGRREE